MSFRIATLNYADSATLGFQGVDALAAPLAHVQSHLRSRAMRTHPGDASVAILIDLGATRTVGDIVLWRHNLADGGMVALTLRAGPNQTGAVLSPGHYTATPYAYADQPGIPGYRWTLLRFDPLACRSLRIDLAGSAGYIELNRLFVGAAVEFNTPEEWGSTLARLTGGAGVARTEAGSVIAPPPGQPSFRQLTLGFSHLLDDERALLLDAAAANQGRDLWISACPGLGGARERDYSMIGRLVSAGGGTAQSWLRYGDRLTIQEI